MLSEFPRSFGRPYAWLLRARLSLLYSTMCRRLYKTTDTGFRTATMYRRLYRGVKKGFSKHSPNANQGLRTCSCRAGTTQARPIQEALNVETACSKLVWLLLHRPWNLTRAIRGTHEKHTRTHAKWAPQRLGAYRTLRAFPTPLPPIPPIRSHQKGPTDPYR